MPDNLLKAGKIVKQFIILILMLLGKAYYDIMIKTYKGVKKASKGTSFTSSVIYLCCLYLEQPDSKI